MSPSDVGRGMCRRFCGFATSLHIPMKSAMPEATPATAKLVGEADDR